MMKRNEEEIGEGMEIGFHRLRAGKRHTEQEEKKGKTKGEVSNKVI